MILKPFGKLPPNMRLAEVRPYYDVLKKKKCTLLAMRLFDIAASIALLVLLSPVFLVLAVIIKLDSKGPVFFKQVRITQYGREFYIFKFRTMVSNAESLGAQVTSKNDNRLTELGKTLRKFRLDEIPQLINILLGDMSFVGTRPEVPKYVRAYTNEMMATLLLKAGVTSEASVKYKDENSLLNAAKDPEKTYIEQILPEKMKYNLASIKAFSFWGELKTMIKTLFAVIK